METTYIKKYFESALANVSKQINNPDLPNDKKDKLKIRTELINELKKNVEWQIKSPIQKQASRIQTLATMRKIEALPVLIKKQELAIKFYDLINTILPYIEAVNLGNITKPILDLLINYRYKIDFSGSAFKGVLPDREEIEKVFKPYFENIALSKNDMFKECYENIEDLYNELISISVTS